MTGQTRGWSGETGCMGTMTRGSLLGCVRAQTYIDIFCWICSCCYFFIQVNLLATIKHKYSTRFNSILVVEVNYVEFLQGKAALSSIRKQTNKKQQVNKQAYYYLFNNIFDWLIKWSTHLTHQSIVPSIHSIFHNKWNHSFCTSGTDLKFHQLSTLICVNSLCD